ncbi:MAG: hypothetical protein ACFFCD_06330 [Promethearchaeota archaeon]
MSEKVENAFKRLETIKEDLNRISNSFEENFMSFNSTLSSGYEEIRSTGETAFQEGEKKLDDDVKEIQDNLKKQNSTMQEEITLKLEDTKTAIIAEISKDIDELKGILKEFKFIPKMDEVANQFTATLNEEREGLTFLDDNVAKMKTDAQGMINESTEKIGEYLTTQNQIDDQLHQKTTNILQDISNSSIELLKNHEDGIKTQLTQKYSELSTNFTNFRENLITELESKSTQFAEMLEGKKNASDTLIMSSINTLIQQVDSIKELLKTSFENERSRFSTSIEKGKADTSQAFEIHKEKYKETIAEVDNLLSDILATKIDEVKTQLETDMMKKAFELMNLQEQQFKEKAEELEFAFSEKMVKSLENIEGTIEVTQDQMQTGIKDILTRIEELIHDQNKQMRDSFLENIATVAQVCESYEGEFITIVDNTLLAHSRNTQKIKAETEEFLTKAIEDFKLKMNEIKENALNSLNEQKQAHEATTTDLQTNMVDTLDSHKINFTTSTEELENTVAQKLANISENYKSDITTHNETLAKSLGETVTDVSTALKSIQETINGVFKNSDDAMNATINALNKNVNDSTASEIKKISESHNNAIKEHNEAAKEHSDTTKEHSDLMNENVSQWINSLTETNTNIQLSTKDKLSSLIEETISKLTALAEDSKKGLLNTLLDENEKLDRFNAEIRQNVSKTLEEQKVGAKKQLTDLNSTYSSAINEDKNKLKEELKALARSLRELSNNVERIGKELERLKKPVQADFGDAKKSIDEILREMNK